MRKMVWILIAFFSLTLLADPAVGRHQELSGKRKKTRQKYTDSAKLIRVKVKQKFAIVLKANPTTGYQWQIAEALDESRLKLVGVRHKAPQTRRVGAGGKDIWTFKSVGPGKSVIAFQYVRPWEKGASPEKSLSFEIEADSF